MSSDGASALEEALALVQGARQDSYGDAVTCHRHIGAVWGGILKIPPIDADRVALMMVGLKLVREAHSHTRDNLIDMAGYIEIADMANARR